LLRLDSANQHRKRVRLRRLDGINFRFGIRGSIVNFLALEPGVAGISDDREQPCSGIVTPETAKPAQRTQKGLLNNILCVVPVSSQPTRKVVRLVKMTKRQFAKAVCQLLIHKSWPAIGQSCAAEISRVITVDPLRPIFIPGTVLTQTGTSLSATAGTAKCRPTGFIG